MRSTLVIVLLLLLVNIAGQSALAADCNGCTACPTGQTKTEITHVAAEADEEGFETFDENESEDDDGFEEFDETTDAADSEISDVSSEGQTAHSGMDRGLFIVLVSLGATALAGIFLRFAPLRKLRYIFLVTFLVWLGFYNGGCPCPISSFQGLILAGFGVDIQWSHLLWFLGLIPLTYLFGKTWCGWICHLGALQEFLYKSNKIEFLKSYKAQRIMKIMRLVLLVVLVGQLAITQSNLFCKIDPFKAAFNMTAFYNLAWVLLGLLILSSLFIYRPFCKSACPIGLVLGWIEKIPGASVLGVKQDECRGCTICNTACAMDAITKTKGNNSVLDNKECIACGECIDACKKDALGLYRKNSEHSDIVQCEKVFKK